jgi:hypothetical protein
VRNTTRPISRHSHASLLLNGPGSGIVSQDAAELGTEGQAFFLCKNNNTVKIYFKDLGEGLKRWGCRDLCFFYNHRQTNGIAIKKNVILFTSKICQLKNK